jgi:hypothetical protein
MRAYRERKAAGEPSVRPSQAERPAHPTAPLADAVQELFDIQADCQVWLDSLPEGLKDSTIAEPLREVCELA